MCWSFIASGTFAIIGLTAAAYFAHKKESKLIWIPLAYFALMKALQAVTYFYLGKCFAPENQMLTLISYLHIAFQPIVINALVMYFIPSSVRKKIFWPVIAVASIFTIIILLKLYPFSWAGNCTSGTALCGDQLCSFRGNWHLAWSIPFNNLFGLSMMTYYLIAVFVLPLIYGSWKTTIYGIIIGPVIAIMLTNHPNEWPAVWCLMSVAIIIGVAIPYLKNAMRVKKWYFWEYLQ